MGPLSSTSIGSLTCLWLNVPSKGSPGPVSHLPDFRANPDSEFVVSNTLAKWKQLEPNEINFSQGFRQKIVSTSCFIFIPLLAMGDFCCLLITIANRLDPDETQHNVGPDQDLNCWHPSVLMVLNNSSIQRVKYGTINHKSNIGKSKSWSNYTFSQICNFWTT